MSDLLSGLDSAAQIVVHASWQAALLAAIVFIAYGTLRNRLAARWKAALWLVVLARFVVPIVPPSPTSLFNLTRTSTSHLGSTPDAVDSPTSHLSERLTPSERGLMRQPGQPVAEPVKLVESPAEATSSTITWKFGMGRVAGLVWLAGALGLLLRLAISQFRLSRMLRSCDDSADPALQSLLARCRAELRLSRSVRLLLAPQAMSPAVVGVWRPTVVLPKDILQTLSAEELRPVLLHELAHIRRRDMLVHWVAALAGAVHWFNPVMWFVARRVAALQELACDEAVLARVDPSLQTGYGHAILKVAESLRSRSPLPGALGAAYSFGLLKERISAISNYRPTSRLGSGFACVLMGALIATGLTDSVSPLTYGDDSPNRNSTRELILQTWKRRESQCASLRFAWKQVVHTHAEALPQEKRARPDSSQPRAGEMVTVQQNCALCLDGERWDFRLDTLGGDRVDGPVGYRDTFDGTLSWNYSGTSAPGKNGTGAVFGPREKRPLSASSLPLCHFARLGVARLDVFDIDRAELAGESYLINGVKCRMLHTARKGAVSRSRFMSTSTRDASCDVTRLLLTATQD
jgi:beta-lactamase regulating signal transducer with metallopeptidase domain